MTLRLRHFLLLALTVWHCAASAQPAPPPVPRTDSIPRREPRAGHSPVDQLRELLSATPADREKYLAQRPPQHRQRIEAGLKEFEELSPEDREQRLRTLELRWHLQMLMKLPQAKRAVHLERIPQPARQVLEERLNLWDILPPPLQDEVTEYSSTLHYFSRLENATPAQQQTIIESYPHDQRERLEAELTRWKALPAAERQAIYERFQTFFTLPAEQKHKTLQVLSATERQQMEDSLRQFEQLPTEQRKATIESFQKFANFTPAERQDFLRNVERWQAMSAEERDTWRKLVTNLPPFPPGMEKLPPLPPLPPPLEELTSSSVNR